jgi:A/G-specific adenine glycosylase
MRTLAMRLAITKGTLKSSSAEARFRAKLLAWYDEHKRDLPWRRSSDPYRIWLSEIMLQQTRVAAVTEHYERFLKRFPSIEKLASARESSVLAAWSGLGYYRRARMLHTAAKRITKYHDGKFPSTTEALRALPGIGRYTAAAVASIAFGEAVAVVDGNVERVLQRMIGKTCSGQEYWDTAETLLDRDRPGDFNQAMMELGATVCAPRQPLCRECPVRGFCATRGETKNTVKKTPQRKKETAYALSRRNGLVLLVQRPESASLMPGMWELPEIDAVGGSGKAMLTVKHSITVTNYTIRIVRAEVPPSTSGTWVRTGRISKLPLTGLARKILRAVEII